MPWSVFAISYLSFVHISRRIWLGSYWSFFTLMLPCRLRTIMNHISMLWVNMMMEEICQTMILAMMDFLLLMMMPIKGNLHIDIALSRRSILRCFFKLAFVFLVFIRTNACQVCIVQLWAIEGKEVKGIWQNQGSFKCFLSRFKLLIWFILLDWYCTFKSNGIVLLLKNNIKAIDMIVLPVQLVFEPCSLYYLSCLSS